MDNQPKINKATLTPEQRDKLEKYQQAETQLQTLEDIAKMTQEIINIVDDSGNVDKIGTLLIDIRETLGGLRDKEAPETPDYAKPVVDAVSKLEKALSASIKGIDVKPQIKVDAPAVNVSPPSVDLKGVEKAVDKLSGSFKDAIKLIKIPENDDSALTEIMSNVLDQLSSIDKGVRTKPQAPNTIKVTNPDGSVISGGGSGTEYTDGGTPPANPVGGTIQWNEGGTWRTVSTAKPLPVTASVSTAGLATDTKQDAAAVLTGAVNETAPASDTASSGLNGRLQRIAQRLTSLIALLPTSLGQKARASSLAVTLSSEDVTALTPTSGLTDAQLRATPVPVSGTVTANLSATDNAVLDQIELNTDYGTVVGGGTETGALRVTVANNSTGVLSVDDNGSTLSVDDGSGSLTVDAPVGTPAFVRLSDGASAISTLPVSLTSVPSHAVTNAGTFAVQAAQSGTWNIGTVTTLTGITNNVNTVEVAPTTVLNGNTNVTTAGTRVVLASSTTCKSVTIKAKAANTGIIYVGSSTVSSANGFALVAGETVTLDIANLTTVNLDASVSGEGVTYVGIN